MRLTRRLFACAVPVLLAACAATPPAVDPAVRPALAPTGTLRVGVYPGSPSSLVKDPRTGQDAGVAHELGLALGERLGVPVRIVQYSRVAQVVDAIGAGQVDFTFTNASEAQFKSASIVTAASMADARQLLQRRGVDAFATNEGILYELADGVPQSRVQNGRWGLEHMAIAIPEGRAAALPFLSGFADEMRTSGHLAAIVARAGLRGTAN